MSFLTSRVARQGAMSLRVQGAVGPRRAFGVSISRGLKESDRHIPDQASHNEHHKQDQLNKQKEGKGHWKPELASDSEEAVKAEKHNSGETPEELAKKTANHAEEKHKAGTSQNDGFGN